MTRLSALETRPETVAQKVALPSVPLAENQEKANCLE